MTEIIRLKEVMRQTGLSKTTIYRRIREGKFPAGVTHEHVAYWAQEVIDQWKNNVLLGNTTPKNINGARA